MISSDLHRTMAAVQSAARGVLVWSSGVSKRFLGLFIADQYIDLLDPRQDSNTDVVRLIQNVDPHPIVGRDDEGWKDSDKKKNKQEEPIGPVWVRMPRETFLGTLFPRLCITVPAGVGKTTAIEQIAAMRTAIHPGHLVIHVDYSWLHHANAPIPAIDYLDRESPEDCFLVQRLRSEIATAKTSDANLPHLDAETVRGWIKAEIQRGNFTLVIDAIDQLSNSKAIPVAQQLNEFLTFYPKIRLVVAGRPNAITQIWPKLFQDRTWVGNDPIVSRNDSFNPLQNLSSDWYFARVNAFEDQQVSRYLAKDRFELMEEIGANSLFLPRTLNLVRTLCDGELQWVRTASDVYWISLNKTLSEDLKPTERDSDRIAGEPVDPRRLLPLLCAMAYAAMSLGDSPATDFFVGESLESFKALAARHYGSSQAISNRLDFYTGLRQLRELNLEALKMMVNERDQTEYFIKFGDPTLRDFLAAHWIAKYADPEDEEVYDFLFDHISFGDWRNTGREFYDFWKLLCEMPYSYSTKDRSSLPIETLPAARNDLAWLTAIALLFRKFEHEEHNIGLRPTEMMYRALPTLLQLFEVARGEKPLLNRFQWSKQERNVLRWTEAEMQDACTRVQALARELVPLPVRFGDAELNLAVPPAANPIIQKKIGGPTANEILLTFLTEFPLLYHGVNPHVRASQNLTGDLGKYQSILRKFNHDFRRIPSNEADSLEGWYSVDERIVRLPQAFQLHHTVVTEDEYSTFVSGKVEKDCFPIVEVNWFDSSIFALFAHGRLPSDLEWEYAARADPGGKKGDFDYWWGKKEDAIKHAWFDDSSGGELKPVSFIGDIEVKGQMVAFNSHNAFGLADMLGLVWEWIADRENKRSRVIRGGSFNFDVGFCSCSTRSGLNPAFAYFFDGVRVARVQ